MSEMRVRAFTGYRPRWSGCAGEAAEHELTRDREWMLIGKVRLPVSEEDDAGIEQLEPVEEPLDLGGTAERVAPEFATDPDLFGPLCRAISLPSWGLWK